ncbi:MAG: tRNA pseudouridine(55) synthase TruB [Clostridia bacterium]|nr:tRNA pseudouridine(55) synthase TruB [Clostridia bacterium]
MNGIVLIDKPRGVTSFKVTASVRKKLNQKRVGHAGTLDPMATGVLPVMVGQAARLTDLLPSQQKRYVAEFMLGMTTDTLDCEGEVLTDQPVNCTKDDVLAVINSFVGEITQVPPMYSALKKDGVRLYDLARQGIEVKREKRTVTIYSIDLTDCGDDRYTIDVLCSKGTYIRTLIDDIGLKLGCGAFMTALRRTQSNGFDISQCIPLDEFMQSDIKDTVKSPEYGLMQYPEVVVTSPQAVRFKNGGELDLNRLKVNNLQGYLRVYGPDNFIGLGEVLDEKGVLKPKCVFSE